MVLCTFIIHQLIGFVMFKRKIYKAGYLIEINDPSLLHWQNVENPKSSKGYKLLINKMGFGIGLSKFSNEFYKKYKKYYEQII